MALIYAKCNQCDSIREVRNAFGGDGGGIIRMSGVKVGDCPCGGSFIVLGDEYVFHNDVATLTQGSIEDRELLTRLIQVVRDSVAAGEAPEKTVERAAELLPSLRNSKVSQFAAWFCSMLMHYVPGKALDMAIDPYLNKPAITIEQFEESLSKAFEEAIQKGLLQPPPQSNEPGGPSFRI